MPPALFDSTDRDSAQGRSIHSPFLESYNVDAEVLSTLFLALAVAKLMIEQHVLKIRLIIIEVVQAADTENGLATKLSRLRKPTN